LPLPLFRRRWRRGPGRGVAFLLDFPSPQPSPRSSQGENSPKTIFAPGSPEPRSRRSNEAERVVAQGNPPRYLGGYEPEVHGQGTAHPALRRVEALWTGESVACGSPPPRGEGRGEGGPIQTHFPSRQCPWTAHRRSEPRTSGVKPRFEALAFSPLHRGHGLSVNNLR